METKRKSRLNREEFKEYLQRVEDGMNQFLSGKKFKIEYRCTIAPIDSRSSPRPSSIKETPLPVMKAMFCDIYIDDDLVFSKMGVAGEKRKTLNERLEMDLIEKMTLEFVVAGIAHTYNNHLTLKENEN